MFSHSSHSINKFMKLYKIKINYFSQNIRNLGKKIFRASKIGENTNILKPEEKQRIKSNFNNIVMGIMKNKITHKLENSINIHNNPTDLLFDNENLNRIIKDHKNIYQNTTSDSTDFSDLQEEIYSTTLKKNTIIQIKESSYREDDEYEYYEEIDTLSESEEVNKSQRKENFGILK
jgi:hypothetical protein